MVQLRFHMPNSPIYYSSVEPEIQRAVGDIFQERVHVPKLRNSLWGVGFLNGVSSLFVCGKRKIRRSLLWR